MLRLVLRLRRYRWKCKRVVEKKFSGNHRGGTEWPLRTRISSQELHFQYRHSYMDRKLIKWSFWMSVYLKIDIFKVIRVYVRFFNRPVLCHRRLQLDWGGARESNRILVGKTPRPGNEKISFLSMPAPERSRQPQNVVRYDGWRRTTKGRWSKTSSSGNPHCFCKHQARSTMARNKARLDLNLFNCRTISL